jgi:hypothetical protein
MAARVLIVGDSQAAGPVGFQLAADLQASGAEVHRIGHSGHGAYDWAEMHWNEYLAALQTFKPTDVLMVFGANDPANAQLEAAFQKFKNATRARLWYAGPPQYPTVPDRQARGANIRALAQRVFGWKYLDAWPYTGRDVARAADGVHFTTAGARVWAAGIFNTWRARSRSWGAVALATLGVFVGGAGVMWVWQRR